MKRWAALGGTGALLVLPPIMTRVAPGFFNNFRLGMMAYAAIFAIAVLSLNLLTGYAGQISLGHGAFLGVGAFTTGYLTWWWGFPFITGFIASALLGGLLAFIVGLPALRIRGLYLAASTLGFGVVMEKMVFNQQELTGGQAGTTVPVPKMGSFEFLLKGDFFVICFAVLVCVWLFDRIIVASKVGRAFFAIREDEDVAASFGVDVSRYKLLAFVISGVIAGIAGSLYGVAAGVAQFSEFDLDTSLTFVIIAVVGGLGSRRGVVVAAIFFAIFPRLFPFLKGNIEIAGSLLLIYTLARHPGGLAQAFLEAREAKSAAAVRRGEVEDDDLPAVLPSLPSAGPPRADAMTSGTVAEAIDISVSFGGLQALNGASLAIPHGKIVGLIGPNGAGKTTLFNVMSGFIRPDSGQIKFKGHDVTRTAPHGRAAMGMGRTFQLVGLGKNLTVRENFLLAQHCAATYPIAKALLRLPGVASGEKVLEERSAEAIAALGFERFTHTPVRNLSHGQQRLVELGCSLVNSPELLLLDEPSGGMSPAAAESLAERLIEIRDKLGRTVLLIEHHIPLVLAVCDEIYVLNFGEILAHGTTEEITSSPDVIAAYFGEAVA